MRLKQATQPRDTSKMTLVTGGAGTQRPPLLIPDPDGGFDPRSLGPAPTVLSTEADRLRQFYRRGVSQDRMPPMPAASSPAGGAQAISANLPSIAEIMAAAAAAQSTADQAIASTFQGTWSATVFYQVGSSVDYNGLIYLCIQANAGETPSSASTFWRAVGQISYAGAWVSTTAYVTGQIVSLTGLLYIALQDSTNENPTSSSGFWQQIGATLFLGAWSSSTAYTIGQMVTRGSGLYIAIQNSTNQDPTLSTGFWQILTNASFYYGDWSSSDAYPIGGQVSFQGNFYVATTANTNQTPSTTSSFWTLVGTSSILIGTWSSSANYVAGNEVTFQPSGGAVNYYVALQANTNKQPDTNPSDWYQIVNGTAIASASSYRPTTNPLTATDAGSNVTVTIASFTMAVAGVGNVSITGSTIPGLAYSTLYYIYYADPTISGGAVVFQDTTTKTNSISSGVNFYVGSILTPPAGGADTIGNNDGGSGGQIPTVSPAALFSTAAQSVSGTGSTVGPTSNALDGNTSTFCTCAITVHTGVTSSDAILTVSLPIGAIGLVQSATLYVRTRCNSGSPTAGVGGDCSYSTNGGVSFTSIWSTNSGAARALTTDVIPLTGPMNLSQVQVRCGYSNTSGFTASGSVDFFEAWIVPAS